MRRKICLVLSLILCCSIQNCYVKARDDGGSLLKLYYEKQSLSNEVNFLQDNEEKKAAEKFQEVQAVLGEKEKDNVLQSYGGCYIDDDANLVIMTNDKKELKREGILADCYIKCNYSYEDLNNTYKELNEMADRFTALRQKGILSKNEEDVLNSISNFFVSVEKNRVVVTLVDINNSKSIEQIRSYVTKPSILYFKQGSRVEGQVTKIKLGQRVWIDNDPGSGYLSGLSVGIKAYYINSKGDKVHGFITAGHGTKKVGNYVYIRNNVSDKAIGKVAKRKRSGKVDASFVKVTNSNYSASRIVYYSNSKGGTTGGVTISKKLYTYLYDGAVGTTVYKAGASTFLTKGKLVSDSATAFYKDVTLKDLYLMDYKSAPGDSGGVVYFKDEDGYQYLGIHQGSAGTTKYVVKWQNIDNSWGIYFE